MFLVIHFVTLLLNRLGKLGSFSVGGRSSYCVRSNHILRKYSIDNEATKHVLVLSSSFDRLSVEEIST